MSDNCFTFTCGQLIKGGIDIPRYFDGMDRIEDHDKFIKKYKIFLLKKLHYKYFESFCDYQNTPQKYDIIIDDNSVGMAINKFKYLSINSRDMKPRMFDITKEKKILRVR